MEIIARINTDMPSGRKIARDLQNKKAVNIEYPLPEHISGKKTYTIDETFTMVEEKLNNHYGTNIKL